MPAAVASGWRHWRWLSAPLAAACAGSSWIATALGAAPLGDGAPPLAPEGPVVSPPHRNRLPPPNAGADDEEEAHHQDDPLVVQRHGPDEVSDAGRKQHLMRSESQSPFHLVAEEPSNVSGFSLSAAAGGAELEQRVAQDEGQMQHEVGSGSGLSTKEELEARLTMAHELWLLQGHTDHSGYGPAEQGTALKLADMIIQRIKDIHQGEVDPHTDSLLEVGGMTFKPGTLLDKGRDAINGVTPLETALDDYPYACNCNYETGKCDMGGEMCAKQ